MSLHPKLQLLFFALTILLSQSRALAVPGGVTFQGRLLDNGVAVESSSVVVTLKVTSIGASECTLYEETQTLNMTNSDGVMSVTLGQGTRTANDKGLTVAQVFSNKPTTVSGLACSTGGTTYTPANADSRNLYVSFNDGGTPVAFASPFVMQSVPYALEADSLSGKGSTDFIQVSTNTTQVKVDNIFAPSSYSSLTSLISGSSSLYAPASGSFASSFDLNSQKITNLAAPTASTDAANKSYVDTTLGTKSLDSATIATLNNTTDSGKILSWNGTTWTAAAPGADATKLPLSGGTMSGAIAMGSNNITGAGYITQNAGKYLQFGNLDDTAEAALVATPLTAGYAGATWYNTTSSQLKYWNGSAVKSMSTSFANQTANQVFAGPTSGGAASPGFRTLVELDVPTLSNSGHVANSATTAASANTASAIVARDASGNFAASTATLSKATLNDSQGTPNTATLQAPTTITTSYILRLPAALPGSSGYVLSSDTSGNLSWITPTTGSVTSIGVTAPVASSGGTTPTISMAKSTGSVDGYLSATDFTTFNSKQTSTLASANIWVGNVSNVATAVAPSGDVSMTNAGSFTVASVGTSTAANIHTAEVAANAATNANTNSTIVKRDSSGNFSASTASLTSASVGAVVYKDSGSNTVTVSAPTTVTTSYSIKWPAAVGSLNQSLTTDASGNLSWNSPTVGGQSALTAANLWVGNSSNVATAVAPSGDVSMTNAGAFTVASVGTSTAANIHTAEVAANAATNANTNSTIVKRDSSGNFAATAVTQSKSILNDTQGTPNTATLQAPTTITTSYILKMPTALPGSSGYVLSSDTTGNLSWIAPTTGSVTTVGVTAPVASSGGSTPTISMAKSTGSVDGYLAATDFTTFNGKQSTALTSAHLWVGNASNVATDIAVSGDVTLTNAGAFAVTALRGKTVSATLPTAAGQLLRYDGTNWTPNYVSMQDLRSTVTGAASVTSCGAGQTLTYTSVADNLACSTIAIADSQITYASQTANKFLASPSGSSGAPTYRAIASADLPVTGTGGAIVNGGNTFGATSSIGNTDSFNLNFLTANSTRMTITSAGNVGIGTTAPGALLDVAGGQRLGKIGLGGQTYYARPTDGNYQASIGYTVGTADFIISNAGGSSNLIFQTGASNERMRIDTSGNVGIGTTAPGAKLDVSQGTAGSTAAQASAAGSAFWKVVNPTNGISTAWNAAAAVEYVAKDTTTSRSINAAGSINATGADFAEWVDWATDPKPEMGSIVQYQGSYVVVSSPFKAAFIGNDTKDAAHAILVAFAGQLPVLVRGPVRVGDLIVANGDGMGRAVAKADATFRMAQNAVGTAWEASDDQGVHRVNVAIGVGLGGGGAGDLDALKSENATMKAWICSKDPTAAFCK